jgi:hypothetical protein
VIAKLLTMPFKPNTCYSITYEDGSGVVFQVEKVVPQALHLTMVTDCETGKQQKLFDLLLRPWKELKKVGCEDVC